MTFRISRRCLLRHLCRVAEELFLDLVSFCGQILKTQREGHEKQNLVLPQQILGLLLGQCLHSNVFKGVPHSSVTN